MSKKILSLALAVVMIVSVFAFSSSAALSEGQVGLKIVTSAKVGDPAGTPVTVDIYYTFPESLDLSTYTHSLGNLCLAFTDAFQINSANIGTQNCGKDALIIGDSYTDVFKPDFTVNDLPTQWTNISAKFNSDDTAKGWDDAILVVPTYLSGGSYNAKTGYPMVEDAPICTIKFITTKTVTADDSFGIPAGTIGNLSKVQYYDTAAGKSVAYAASNIIMDEATGYAAAAPATPDVYELDQKTRAYEKSEGVYKTATFFGFKTIAPDFNAAGTSQYITDITAQVTIDGTPVAAGDIPVIRYVYDLGNGEYGFRVILDNIADGDAVITVTPVVTTTDGATFNVETVTFTAATAEAV